LRVVAGALALVKYLSREPGWEGVAEYLKGVSLTLASHLRGLLMRCGKMYYL